MRTLPEFPGADPRMGGTQPGAINDRGRIVDLAYDTQGGSRGFQLQRGKLTPIDAAPDAVFTRPLDINNQRPTSATTAPGHRPPRILEQRRGQPAGAGPTFWIDSAA